MSILTRLYESMLGSTSLSPAKLGRDDLRIYQTRVIDIIKGIWTQPDTPPGAIIALEPGAGKTVSSLTAISELLASGHIRKPLIVAPLLVADTVWDAEIEEWQHLAGMTCSKILGTEKQRIEALTKNTDIYVINKENLVWLWNHLGNGKKWCFDALFIDEASMLKNGKKRTMKRTLTRFGALAARRVSAHQPVGPDLAGAFVAVFKGNRQIRAYAEQGAVHIAGHGLAQQGVESRNHG